MSEHNKNACPVCGSVPSGMAEKELADLSERIKYLQDGVDKYLDGDYPCPDSGGCAHEKYRWEECSVCDDMYFSGLLNNLRDGSWRNE